MAVIACATGVHEATFHVDQVAIVNGSGTITVGLMSATQASHRGSSIWVSYVYHANGEYYASRKCDEFGVQYGTGDEITVVADLDANTVAFRKNGVDVGSPHDIAPGEAYQFLFDAQEAGDAVTIVGGS